MKNTILYIAAGLVLLVSCKEENSGTAIPASTGTQEQPEQACYLKVVQKDSIILNFTRKGDSISGVFDWKPYEKDKKISTFKGTVDGKTANTIASYQAEGMQYDEELVFTLEGNTASVQYGITEQGPDGIWRYKPVDNMPVQVLDKVRCR